MNACVHWLFKFFLANLSFTQLHKSIRPDNIIKFFYCVSVSLERIVVELWVFLAFNVAESESKFQMVVSQKIKLTFPYQFCFLFPPKLIRKLSTGPV